MESNGAWSVVLVVPRGTLLLVQARGFITRDRNFPGGDADIDDRTAQHTASRLLQEETGLLAKPEDFQILDTWTGERGQPVYVYLVTRFRGRPRATGKGKVFWTKKYESLMAMTSTFAQYNTRIIQKLMEIRPAA
jgi:8-oxo-dGTP pyrophosphatase MutT (NUDIX family)